MNTNVSRTAPLQLPAHWVQRRQEISEDLLLIEHFDAITEIRSVLVQGTNKTTQKPYTRYDRTYITYSMRPTSTGRRVLRIFVKAHGPRKYNGVRDSSLPRSNGHLSPRVRVALERMISRVSGQVVDLEPAGALRAHMYPILAAMNANPRSGLSVEPLHGIGGMFRLDTAQELTRALFGKKRYRKDLVRSVAGAPPWGIRIAYELRTVLEVDWVVEFLLATNARRGRTHDVRSAGLRAIFEAVPKHRRRALLLNIAVDDNYRDLVWDSLRMAGDIFRSGYFQFGMIADSRNWQQIHNHLITLHQATLEAKSAGERQAKIPRTPVTIALHGTEVAGFRLETANNLDDLLRWGADLRNCIGSYFRHARTGTSNLFVLVADGKLVGNMELTPRGQIRQLVGFANAPLNPELAQAIAAHVEAVLAPVLRTTVTLAA